MCGITGFWTPDGLNLEDARATVTAMTDVLRHRGPDDEGAWIDPVAGIALGFRRLAGLCDRTSATAIRKYRSWAMRP